MLSNCSARVGSWNQPWIFIGRIRTEWSSNICPFDGKNWLTGKDSEAAKNWRWEEKQATEDKMVGWHHGLSGHEYEQTLGDGETGKPGMLQFMGSQRVRHN